MSIEKCSTLEIFFLLLFLMIYLQQSKMSVIYYTSKKGKFAFASLGASLNCLLMTFDISNRKKKLKKDKKNQLQIVLI